MNKAIVLFITFLIFPFFSCAETVVVVSSQSSAKRLTADQVKDIFLGRLSTLPDTDQVVVPVDQPEDTPTREDFYRKTSGKSGPQLTAYWSRILFTGKGQRPREVPSSTALKKLLANNPNAVGYMSRSDLDASVKVIFSVE